MHPSCARLALLGFVLAFQDVLAESVTLLPIPFSFYDFVDGEIEGFIVGSDGAGRTTYIMSDNGKVSHILTESSTTTTQLLTSRPTETATLTPGFFARRADNLGLVTYTLGAGSAIATVTDEDMNRNLHTVTGNCAFRSGNSGTADCQRAFDAHTYEYVTEARLRKVILQPDSRPKALFTAISESPGVITTTQARGNAAAAGPQRTVVVTMPGANPMPVASPIQTSTPGLPVQNASGSATVLPDNGDFNSQSAPFDTDVTTIFVTADPTPLGDLPSRRGGGVRHRPSTLVFTFVLSLVLSML